MNTVSVIQWRFSWKLISGYRSQQKYTQFDECVYFDSHFESLKFNARGRKHALPQCLNDKSIRFELMSESSPCSISWAAAFIIATTAHPIVQRSAANIASVKAIVSPWVVWINVLLMPMICCCCLSLEGKFVLKRQ